MRLRNLLLLSVLVGTIAVAGVFVAHESHLPPAPADSAATVAPKPNVVLISLDTTRPDHLGCYGYGRPTSPNLDRVCARRRCFRQARSQAPLTLLAHMALFTSMIPSHNTVDNLEAVLPSGIPTIAQVLRAHGYNTAAFVNDGQVQARWGFNRGFDNWQEFREGKPEGDCEHITVKALDWLAAGPAEPFFLFLHYYDPHAPYDPPPAYREAFGSTFTLKQGRELTKLRRPEDGMPAKALLEQAVGAYDGEIAWVDHVLGQLLDRLPKNTLLVVFSDHGEPFKEHGWLVHGATLYEEDIRTALFLRHPTLLPRGATVDEPVMLLDVMPTVLHLCDIEAPPTCEGVDLSPTWRGGQLRQRFQLAENKAPFDWCVAKMAQLGDWKLIYSLFDGKRELYHLPDEQTERLRHDSAVAETLFGVIHKWMEQEDYWIVYGHGPGTFNVTLTPRDGQVANLMPIDDDFTVDRYREINETPNKRSVHWTFRTSGTRGLYFQIVPPESPLKVEAEIDGKQAPDKVFLGPRRVKPPELPWRSIPVDEALAPPVIDEKFKPGPNGLYVMHHRGKQRSAVSPVLVPLDEKTIEQLRTLGYIR